MLSTMMKLCNKSLKIFKMAENFDDDKVTTRTARAKLAVKKY